MGKPLAMDLRKRALAAVDAGISCRAAAGRVGVVGDPLGRAAAGDGELRAEAARRRHAVTADRGAACGRHGRVRGGAGPEPRRAAGPSGRARHRRVELDPVALLPTPRHDAEKKTGHALEQDRADVVGKRRTWFEAQPDLDPGKLVFIDETWTATNMARTHGRCARGERLRMGFPHGHRKTTTLVAGLRLDGMVAPMVLDGPINGDWFEAYVRRVLAPTLRAGDVVIMDNLSSHKRASIRAMIEARGARLAFLPPYSPDFNPIEMAFAKLKALLRKAAERTVDGLWATIGRLVDVFTPQECANYFAAAGYDAD